MKKERSILIAFLLNLSFSLFEIIGGILTGSVAILSDSLHDACDAMSIGVSYLLEKKSTRDADETYTYGYGRYSVIGGAFTTLVLILGSVGMIYTAFMRLLSPTDIHYDGMILFALFGISINSIAAYLTRGGESINCRAVSLHMLEDVLGWAVVLAGAVIMRFTDLRVIDPVMSICTSAFILSGAVKNMCRIVRIVTDRIPVGITPELIHAELSSLECVSDVHHIHVRSIDGNVVSASLHIVTDGDAAEAKRRVRERLRDMGIIHATLETEAAGEECPDAVCRLEEHSECGHGHHHHNHHH